MSAFLNSTLYFFKSRASEPNECFVVDSDKESWGLLRPTYLLSITDIFLVGLVGGLIVSYCFVFLFFALIHWKYIKRRTSDY